MHTCKPFKAAEGEILFVCECGKVWSYEPTTGKWSELITGDPLPFPDPGEVD